MIMNLSVTRTSCSLSFHLLSEHFTWFVEKMKEKEGTRLDVMYEETLGALSSSRILIISFPCWIPPPSFFSRITED